MKEKEIFKPRNHILDNGEFNLLAEAGDVTDASIALTHAHLRKQMSDMPLCGGDEAITICEHRLAVEIEDYHRKQLYQKSITQPQLFSKVG